MSLINKKQCKQFLLDQSTRNRNGKFTRVAANVYDHLEGVMRREMIDFVRSHPSIGKTLTTGEKNVQHTNQPQ